MHKQMPVKKSENKRLAKDYVPENAFSRVAEAQLLGGNSVRLLKNAAENYPAWLEAIKGAKKYIHFECYIIHEDEQGKIFADALIAKAREGVRVRLIYDWLGGFGKTSAKYWRRLRDNGVEVRCYNPPKFQHPLGWLSRDHRKTLVIDGEVAFVFGLCVGQMWVGYPEKNIEPWRDTGLELHGQAIIEVSKAFADVWNDIGDDLPDDEIADGYSSASAGDINLRVVAGKPGDARIYRLDQMIAAMAQKTLWLTDAYFAGTDAYVQSLRAAALDGVDVRLLVPQTTDIPVMRAISLSGYRNLLDAGVRVFEWNGSMLHAKTAVADGYWSRVGSTNLNIASWLSNCEIDVLIEDVNFGRQMEEMYLADLENATEIVLHAGRKPRPVSERHRRKKSLVASSATSGAQYAPSAMVIGSALGSSFVTGSKKRRELGMNEAKITLSGGFILLVLGIVAIFWSKLIAIPLGILALWFAVALFINAYQYFRQSKERDEKTNGEITNGSPENSQTLQAATAEIQATKNES